jgi:hypothetical protein
MAHGLKGFDTDLILFREIVKIKVPFNFPKVKITFGKFFQVKHSTFKLTISLN